MALHDGDRSNDEFPEPDWSPNVELVEFDGDCFRGSDVVSKRLSGRAQWARARFGRGSSWTIQPVGKHHVIATRASEWPEPEPPQGQSSCQVSPIESLQATANNLDDLLRHRHQVSREDRRFLFEEDPAVKGGIAPPP
jgi:hypothetical protein